MSEDKNIGLTIKYDDDDWNGWGVTFGKNTYKLAKKYSNGLHYINLPNIPNTLRIIDVIFINGYRFAYSVIRKNNKIGNIIFRLLDEGLFQIIMELK